MARDPAFHTTRWSVVRAAASEDSSAARQALGTLCEAYWFPLYGFARRSGHDPETAQDLTQGFFARLLEQRDLRPDRERGRFRNYLLGAFRHFIAHERERKRAIKRGGSLERISLELAGAETRYVADLRDDLTPEKLFDRAWALQLLSRSLDRLGEEYDRQGKGELFRRLRPTLVGAGDDTSRAELAATLQMSESAVNVAIHRLRRRYRDRLRSEVADTLTGPGDTDDELALLYEALGL